MKNKKGTHIRIEKDLLSEMRRECPGMSDNSIVAVSFNTFKGVQKIGRFLYGNVWKKPKQKSKFG